MKIRWNVLGVSLAVLALSGCASMSSEECVATDWWAVGHEDGARGYTSERFSRHRTACAKHGITADFGAYKEGREQGLQRIHGLRQLVLPAFRSVRAIQQVR